MDADMTAHIKGLNMKLNKVFSMIIGLPNQCTQWLSKSWEIKDVIKQAEDAMEFKD